MAIVKSKSIKLLAIALGFGVLAALLAVLYLKAREADLRAKLTPDDQKINVVVAARDLMKGTTLELDPKKFAVRPIPREYVHNDAVTYAEFEQLQGKKLVENLGKGKALLHSFLDDNFPRDFSDTIPLKRRAMTVQVDEVNSVNGFIRPGNRIDLLVTLPAGTAGGESSSDMVVPVLENVEVLATGRESSQEYEEKILLLQGGVAARPPGNNYTSITINVTPEEAALVETAQDKGDLLALLRNRNDTSGSGFTDITPADLLGNAGRLARDAALREASASAEKQGLTVGEDGLIRTKDGVVLKDQNLVIAEDGTIMTKDGIVLSGRGLTVNEKGELVTADGTVVNSEDLQIAADGSVMTKDGKILSGGKGSRQTAGKALPNEGLTVGEDGRVMTKDGKVLQGVTVDENGNVMKDGKVLAGVKLDKNGNLVDENGKSVVMTESGVVLKGATVAGGKALANKGLVVNEDGTVTTADGQVLEGITVDENGNVYKDGKLLAGVKLDENGNLVDENGRPVVITDAGDVLKGVTTNEKGEIVMEDGTVVSPEDLIIAGDGSVMRADQLVVAEDGTVMSRDGKRLAGITADVAAAGTTEAGLELNVGRIDYIVGGVSKDGVATVNSVPISN